MSLDALNRYVDRLKPQQQRIGTVIAVLSGNYGRIVLDDGTHVTALLNDTVSDGEQVICFRPSGSSRWQALALPRRDSNEQGVLTGGDTDTLTTRKPIAFSGTEIASGILWAWHAWNDWQGVFEVQVAELADKSDASTVGITTGCNFLTIDNPGTYYGRVRSVSISGARSAWTDWVQVDYGGGAAFIDKVFNPRLMAVYDTITEGISDAASGDALYIPAGVYMEDLSVTQDLVLVGWQGGRDENRIAGTITVSGSGTGLKLYNLNLENQDAPILIADASDNMSVKFYDCVLEYVATTESVGLDLTSATSSFTMEMYYSQALEGAGCTISTEMALAGYIILWQSAIHWDSVSHAPGLLVDYVWANFSYVGGSLSGSATYLGMESFVGSHSSWSGPKTFNTNLRFRDLADVPGYIGQAGLVATVNATEDAIEFTTGGSGVSGGGDITTLRPIHTPRWYVDGPLSAAIEVDGVWRVSENMEISSVLMYLFDTGSSSSTIVDVDVSGDSGASWSTLFTTQANRPQILGGATTRVATSTPDIIWLYQGDLLRMSVDQAAVGARGLSLQIEGEVLYMQKYIYNISLASADTEYSQALPAGMRKLAFRARTNQEVRYAFETGKVAGPTAPYATLKAAYEYFDENIVAASETLYLASSVAGVVVEVEVWAP